MLSNEPKLNIITTLKVNFLMQVPKPEVKSSQKKTQKCCDYKQFYKISTLKATMT